METTNGNGQHPGHSALVAFLGPSTEIRLDVPAAVGGNTFQDTMFHWNGSEMVLTSIGATGWSGLSNVAVRVQLVDSERRLEFSGNGSADRVVGVAPEYRAAAVRCFGAEAGHAAADAVAGGADTHRFFISPLGETIRIGGNPMAGRRTVDAGSRAADTSTVGH